MLYLTRITDDFEWEDPIEKFIGKEEFGDFLYFCKYVQDIVYNGFGEFHSTHEMVLDWSLKVNKSTVRIPLRLHQR